MTREYARDALIVLVVTGNPTSEARRDQLIAAAEIDEDFRAHLASLHRGATTRDTARSALAADLSDLSEWSARLFAAAQDGGEDQHVHSWEVQSMWRNGRWHSASTFPRHWVGRRPSVRAHCPTCGATTQEPIAPEPPLSGDGGGSEDA